MNADDVLRALRQVRYSPRKGRRISIAWVAAQAGYGGTALYNAILTGHVTKRMADRVGAVFQNVQITKDQVARSSLGEYGGGIDARGGRRPVRRLDDGRLRQLRGKSSAATASLRPRQQDGERTFARPPWWRHRIVTRRRSPEQTNASGHRRTKRGGASADTGPYKSSHPHRHR
jgi:hypothetical protein